MDVVPSTTVMSTATLSSVATFLPYITSQTAIASRYKVTMVWRLSRLWLSMPVLRNMEDIRQTAISRPPLYTAVFTCILDTYWTRPCSPDSLPQGEWILSNSYWTRSDPPMARKVKDKQLDTREARGRVTPRAKPYWRAIERGLHLGYRKLKGKAGTWCARHYIGDEKYEIEALGIADDFSDADGVAILSYWDAQTKARERMVKRTHAAVGATGPLTVSDAMDAYLEYLESKNPRTAIDARSRDRLFIRPKLGQFEIDSLTTEQLQRWLASIGKSLRHVRSPGGVLKQLPIRSGDDGARARRATANRTLTTLRAALNRAFRGGKATSDRAWRSVEPFENVDSARIRYLTVAEAKRLVNGCDTAFRPMLQAALQTGARYGELIRLQVYDFNSDSGTVAIRQSKSGKPRHVVLTDEGIALFRELSAGRSGSQPLIRRTNGLPFRANDQAWPMAAAVKRAKISPPITFHGLRHTWASLAVMNVVPLMVVARNLGHTDTRMVEKHYGHLAPSYIVDAIRAGAPRFGFTPDKKIVDMAKARQ